ncbi:glutamyl-tRNA synthetase [Clostridium acetobutylicum]|jgi:glutamyl-tRNA synthetase|uniref:Glutamate--tRNA ligase n=1 Tax=Clostridium acetobutylicum (strain ATCC 824 / DSM 792 / JCM 1419 / IAM 19013 / LMG 5710 / NBRC 13948 / NRRL B-527 / VKM B-1787 / 2291 / W) TaxID=272562 RepID=SYE_CLOAB|nr:MULTISPECIES: glutamate--tRNA ligase [Clostridium]Q97KC9.1 RecName: Full=Glutamate--tRNA ligase; AltName: Full=Glutamyl-tRNA synthetase; Short=GluRS [Clostridium acetobutylicum ATCC 824]AAK78966.1 Glutamyl-tRNA synthetase [Clostridium acetobutylicum ATCC 824]ADZ20040.1 Glutamyl-tRNA synthetase [Clostridium acetobutylicum EA 2018]AEI33493.1 glutamyl-tRNA synthetase [Clostridium acetobutylicum DSM 1731]AWV81777.1 glutamate--tRNA ligase [Clostridium acetobutylicum]KHD35602.1 glutamyl-tRNA syn
MAANEIRTRFAPSPTGYMHIGNLRTALYTYLIAKHEDGKFILRIEDTDQERYVEDALAVIYKTLEMTGLKHDEGPDVGGPVGPYVQSERKGLYLDYAKKLVEKGEAYYCFCSKERLDILKTNSEALKRPFKYDKHCANLSKEEVQEKLDAGVPYVIRQNNPTTGSTTFDDVIYGRISVDNSELDDMILIKSDGYPTYNFANVVDDHLMGITHVVRGNEYLSSAPKYNRLYEAFGWNVPIYVHCPPIMKDAHSKLSKRNGDASFQDLIEKGYLKEAVLNYIALLGWNPEGTNEILSLEDMVKLFDYTHINKSPAVFDPVKLKWMNGEYVRKLSLDEFHKAALSYYDGVITKENIDLKKISELIQTRVEIFSDIPEMVDFFNELPDYDIEMYTHKKMKTNPEISLDSLKNCLPVIENIEDWNLDNIQNTIMNYIKDLGVKNGVVLWPLRTALSGKKFTPGGAFEIADIIGKDESIRRIKIGIEKLEK